MKKSLVRLDKRKRYYVYTYSDPSTGEIFYIGKGCGERSKVHLKCSVYDCNTFKTNKIKKIINEGSSPLIHIVGDSLDEEEAFTLESSLIEKYGRRGIDPSGSLTNRVSGFFGGSVSTFKRKPFTKQYKITRRDLYRCGNPAKVADTVARHGTPGVKPLTQQEIDRMCSTKQLTRKPTKKEQDDLMSLPKGWDKFSFRP